MRYLRIIVAVGAILAVAGCSKSNPLLGKWKLAPGSNPACSVLNGVEFTEKTMTMDLLGKQMATVTYGRDGERYLVTAPNGIMAFEKDGNGIKSVTPFECHLVPAS
jgi:hypothetical protein